MFTVSETWKTAYPGAVAGVLALGRVANPDHHPALEETKAQLEQQAKINLQIAEKDLRDALVYAPISGRVSMKLSEPGEMGQPGKPIVRIEDASLIDVSAFLPAQYYHQVIPGKHVFAAGLQRHRQCSYR